MSNDFIGLFVNTDMITKEHRGFVLNLQKASSKCSEMSIGSSIAGVYNPYPEKPAVGPNTIRGVVLVLPSEASQMLSLPSEQLLEWLNTEIPFEESLGHSYVVYDKQKDVCGLYDICLHEKYYGKNMGTVLSNIILDSVLLNIPNTTTLWIGINIKNKQFDKVVSLYAKVGFEQPYISRIDPFGNEYDFFFMSLNRQNDYIDESEIHRDSVLNEILYAMTQYASTLRGNACDITAYFNIPNSKWLQKLPLSASTLNSDGTISQKEIGGVFTLKNPIKDYDEKYAWEIVINKNEIISGKEDSVNLVVGRYNYHTHPRESYNRYGVLIGYPSGQDYVAYLFSIKNAGTVFHCVVSLEGIYIISLSQYWTSNIKTLVQLMEQNENGLVKYIKDNFEIPKIIPQGLTATQAGKLYPNEINNKILFKSHPQPVFQSQFLSWDDIWEKKKFTVMYPSLFNQCFATDRSMAALNRLQNTRFEW